MNKAGIIKTYYREGESGDELACPSCGTMLDAATGANTDHPPEAGDASVCFYCADVTIFTGEGMRRRQPTPDEQAEIDTDPGIKHCVELVKRRSEITNG